MSSLLVEDATEEVTEEAAAKKLSAVLVVLDPDVAVVEVHLLNE